MSDKEKVSQWMMDKGYATGHGDTIEDLLKELEWQVAPVHAVNISQERVDETAKRKHEWVGLTLEEINEVLGSDIHDEPSGELKFIRAIEAKLKEKNE